MTREEKYDAAYAVLNKAEAHDLDARLRAVATIFKHGTVGMGDKAALDRMAQGISFICEALTIVTTPQIVRAFDAEGKRVL